MSDQIIFKNPDSNYENFVSVHDLPKYNVPYFIEELAAPDYPNLPQPSESETAHLINSIAQLFQVSEDCGCANARQRLSHMFEHGTTSEAIAFCMNLENTDSLLQACRCASSAPSAASATTATAATQTVSAATAPSAIAATQAASNTTSVPAACKTTDGDVSNGTHGTASDAGVVGAGTHRAAGDAGLVGAGDVGGTSAMISGNIGATVGALYDVRPTYYCGRFESLDQFRKELASYQPFLQSLNMMDQNDPLTGRLTTTQRWDIRFMLESDFSQPFDAQFIEEELPNVMLKNCATPSFELCARIIADKWARPHYFIGLLPWLNLNTLPSILAFPLRRLLLQQNRDIQIKRGLSAPLISYYSSPAQCKEAEEKANIILCDLLPESIKQDIHHGRRSKIIPRVPVVQYYQSDAEIDMLRLRFDSRDMALSTPPELILEARKLLDRERCKLKYQRKVAILKEMGVYDENNLNLNLSLSPFDYCYDVESNIFIPKIELDRSLAVKQLYLSFEEDPAIPLCVSEDHYRNFKLTTDATRTALDARAKRLRALKTMQQAMLTTADGDDVAIAKRRADELGIDLNEQAITQAHSRLQPARASYDRITHDVTIPVDKTGGYAFLNETPRIGRHLLFSEDLTRAYVDHRVRDDEQIREISGGTYGQGIKRSDAITTSEACHFTLTAPEALDRFDKLELYEGLLNTVAASSRRAQELNDYGEDIHKSEERMNEHIRDPRLENTYSDALRELLFVNGQISLKLQHQNQVATVVSNAAEAQNIAPTNNYDGTTITAARHIREDEGKQGASNSNKFRPEEDVINNFLNDVNTDNVELRQQLRKKITAAVMQNYKHQPKGKEIDCQRAQLIPAGEDHIFHNRFAIQGYNTAIHLLIDVSGSMCNIPDPDADGVLDIHTAGQAAKYLYSYRYGQTPLQRQCASRAYHACKAALEIASSLNGINGVSVGASFFPGLMESSSTHTVLLPHDNIEAKAPYFIQTPHGSTPMHEALYCAYNQLLRENESRKIIIMITDGAPDCVEETRNAIEHLVHSGVELYTIGIDTQDKHKLFPHFSTLSHPEKLTELISNLLVDLSKRAPDVLVA